jgi:hypothetical protein
MESQNKVSSMMELGRYFNSRDEPIVLSQTHNHARLVLSNKSRTKKNFKFSGGSDLDLNYPADEENVMVADASADLGPCSVAAPGNSYCM